MIEFLVKSFFIWLTLALEAWVAMLALGAAHSNMPAIPALGYTTVLFLFLVVGSVAGYVWGATKISDS